MASKLEFYVCKTCIAVVESSMVPPEESLISIAKRTYIVDEVTFAVDNAGSVAHSTMRCNIDLREVR